MNRTAVRIIPLKRSHIKACDEIAAASEPWKTLGERIDFSSSLSRSRNRTDIRAYVCIVGSKTVGFVIFTPEPVFGRGGYIRAVGVAPEMRRQGIGKELLSFAEKGISRRSPNVYLCVSSFNRRAQAFYKSLGYRKAGKLPGLIIPGASEYIYWKRLKPVAR